MSKRKLVVILLIVYIILLLPLTIFTGNYFYNLNRYDTVFRVTPAEGKITSCFIDDFAAEFNNIPFIFILAEDIPATISYGGDTHDCVIRSVNSFRYGGYPKYVISSTVGIMNGDRVAVCYDESATASEAILSLDGQSEKIPVVKASVATSVAKHYHNRAIDEGYLRGDIPIVLTNFDIYKKYYNIYNNKSVERFDEITHDSAIINIPRELAVDYDDIQHIIRVFKSHSFTVEYTKRPFESMYRPARIIYFAVITIPMAVILTVKLRRKIHSEN